MSREDARAQTALQEKARPRKTARSVLRKFLAPPYSPSSPAFWVEGRDSTVEKSKLLLHRIRGWEQKSGEVQRELGDGASDQRYQRYQRYQRCW